MGPCFWRFLVLSSVCILQTEGCTSPALIPGEDVPNILDLAKSSYRLLYEINYPEQKSSVYITDIYDKLKQRGRLDIDIEGSKKRLYYFKTSNEIFELEGYTCESTYMTEATDENFAKKYGGWKWASADIIGPSNMFLSAYQDFRNVGSIGKEDAAEYVRGLKTNVWTQCLRDYPDTIVKYYFTQNDERAFGIDVPVPVQVTVQEKSSVVVVAGVMGIQLEIPETELNEALSIPVGYGCRRLTTETLPKLPTFAKKSMTFEAEMVYTPVINNTAAYTYVSNIKYSIDADSGHSAIHYSQWKSHDEASMAQPGDNLFKVFDIPNGYLYTVDKTLDQCTISRFMKDSSRNLVLPDGSTIDLGDSNIFFFNGNASEYQYLGESVLRGIPVSVFEKKKDDEDDFNEIIVTQYHASGKSLQTDEYNAPLTIVYTNINVDPGKFVGELVLNFYSFHPYLTKKNELFDVTACFTEKDQSKWFQVVYPLGDYSSSDVTPFLPYIEENYIGMLTDIDLLNSPVRIPKILVDIDSKYIYITGLLLERPPFMLDFFFENGKALKMNPEKTTVMLSSRDNCAKKCLADNSCTVFSYCGAVCTLATDNMGPSDFEPKDGCVLYNNYVKLFLGGDSLPTMDILTSRIKDAVDQKEPQFSLKGDKDIMDFRPALFKDEIAFGINGLTEEPEEDIDVRFNVFAIGYTFDKAEVDSGWNFGKLSFSTCKQACINRDGCETFSFCMASSECILSSKHIEDIQPTHISQNTQCKIFRRNYEDFFQRNLGLSIAHEAEKTLNGESLESCAKACKQETSIDCLSFDFCYNVTSWICLLHKEHFTDFTETQHITSDSKCGHYSRKFQYDFKVDRNKAFVEKGPSVFNISTEDCAKLCREGNCKGFGFCTAPQSVATECVMSVDVGAQLDSNRCNAYTKKADAGPKNRNTTQEVVVVKKVIEGHSKSTTGGLAFLMLLIGLAVGVGALFGYGYYRANKK